VRPARRLLPLLAAVLAAGAAAQDSPAPAAPEAAPAAGGIALVGAAEKAPEVVIGRVRAPERIDLQGWRAALVVERSLRGGRAAGDELAIAWEELAPKRPPRFVDGGRVVVALEPLPPGSLWSQRFPKRDALAVAARGEAFLRDPEAGTLDPLAAWLSLAPEARETAPGIEALAELARTGEPRVAASALQRLDGVSLLAERVFGSEAAVKTLAALLADPARPPELRRQALDLAARRALRPLEPAIEAQAAQASDVQGAAVDALARLRGGLPASRAAELLRSPDPAVRAAVARRAGDGLKPEKLRALLASDPAGEVRGAAAEALAAREGVAAMDPLVAALRESDPAVRGGAMRGLAGLGAAALPGLRREIWETSATAPPNRLAGALFTLAMIEPDGVAELQRIAHEHPSERIRKLAELALGRIRDKH
jgi:HEAT repeat protein